MTNITLSIDDDIYDKMKKHSEIKWSEFVRKIISKRIEELEKLSNDKKENLLSIFASEQVLKKDWDNKFDERWDDV